MEDFSKYKMKDYKHWSVFIHPNQGYLGRCVVWCNREDALDFADATEEESTELVKVLKDLREAVKNAFQADWFNYALLGNETRHLHCHFIPRYSSERNFEGITFRDVLWGHNYKTDRGFETPQEVLEKIKTKLEENL
ncbi:MAG: hypothetical protein A3B91_02390 [Candidatus Yanofskybacteria bacterium RIFCSPHIGHO2_02_FULL_41_29]|uniref:HIT domain-containing protein n=1 Tax=Candidatus Yanofskybacteria bacterium RIFCSPHIGHO2_01_FULL_41_53 TaxID=1802663 RepID=A0A1F8EGG8_9BACT|nr:MAG: hypothetical protein A2650_04750 [Candidatus Yanofskybacteria bacterium RIFCSPHIGHO2_01_FULL_41_53]OGN12373.1 MAG: hypothetical protein A3B91_02390 [Candidatus Yanofskybacteria bacterium RIFCSPHIGHO2_02_FULL_41_29]OGN16861.1 MAG: hypothetical protein A3F48_00085 [Candidatus Yanofskybacteria bacterium RIFCSPHIGHO2_12_FULL_41_9]OGN23239.1 MAG: hypothetical protein A2916_02805 [Candidatus Yanofskybacteria bacterium RIFCSPLOWO2_01_FULL_41_67]OGN28864.1 MAG: hypothetical protein A3H54_01835 